MSLEKKTKKKRIVQKSNKMRFSWKKRSKPSGSWRHWEKCGKSSTKIKVYPDEVIEFQGWKMSYKHQGGRVLSPLKENNISWAGLKWLSRAILDEQDNGAMLRTKIMTQNS